MTPAPETRAAVKRRIFVVDDHPLVREWLGSLIDQQGDLCVCGSAEKSGEALEKIARLQPDAVVVDLSLKGETGLELIKQLQNLADPPRVIVLSMHDESLYGERALRAGALGYVMKSAATGTVVNALRQVLAGKMAISDALAAQMARRIVGRGSAPLVSPVSRLSDRELEVFRLLGRSMETRRIGEELHLSPKTVQVYCGRIKEKLGLTSFTALIGEAVRCYEAERDGRVAS